MILIINQHKGDDTELIRHLESFKNNVGSNFYMVLVIDQYPVHVNLVTKLNEYRSELSNLYIHYNDSNKGLSQSRSIAIDVAESLKLDFSHIIFGCTNSEYSITWDESVYNSLVRLPKRPTIIPCEYPKEQLDRIYGESYDTSILDLDTITWDKYYNSVNKPDFTLMIPWECRDNVQYIQDEKYYPEEIILMESCNQLNDWYLNVYPTELQSAWYNKSGMTLSFDRGFMVSNSRGFLTRARVTLIFYQLGYINLSLHKLKYTMYDYVTFGGDPERLNNPLLKELYWFYLRGWIESGKGHKLKFIENA